MNKQIKERLQELFHLLSIYKSNAGYLHEYRLKDDYPKCLESIRNVLIQINKVVNDNHLTFKQVQDVAKNELNFWNIIIHFTPYVLKDWTKLSEKEVSELNNQEVSYIDYLDNTHLLNDENAVVGMINVWVK